MAGYNFKKRMNLNGQSLVEIIIAMAIGTILISASVGSIVLLLKYNLNTKTVQIASSLNRQMMDDIRSISESDWLNIYNKNKGASNHYYISSSTRQIVFVSNNFESLIIEGRQFSRYFYIENVSRDANNNIEIIHSFANDDPSTQKITAIVQWGGGGNIKEVQYLTRFRNAVFVQTDWSGGFNQEIFATTSVGTIINGKFAISSSNIDFSSTPGSIRLILPAETGTLVSSVFDTQINGGAAINTIMWQGTANGGKVKFQIASSNNSGGPWNYYGLNGTSLDSDVYAPLDSNEPIEINPIQHNNKRYVRYKAILESNLAQTQSPTIDDIIINWSP